MTKYFIYPATIAALSVLILACERSGETTTNTNSPATSQTAIEPNSTAATSSVDRRTTGGSTNTDMDSAQPGVRRGTPDSPMDRSTGTGTMDPATGNGPANESGGNR
jgi:hypothetical protein